MWWMMVIYIVTNPARYLCTRAVFLIVTFQLLQLTSKVGMDVKMAAQTLQDIYRA
jgi:hypothetical protein